MTDLSKKSDNLNTSQEYIKATDITDTVREYICSILYDDDFPILNADEQKRIDELVSYIIKISNK